MERYEDIFKKARSADIGSLSFWYSLFGLKEDPFLSPTDDIDYYVSTEIVDGIIYDVGVATRGVPLVTLLVGPTGSGKTSLLHYVHSVLKSIVEKDPSLSLHGQLVQARDLFETEEEEQVQPWIKMAKARRDFLLVDDAGAEHVKLIVREFVSTPYKIFSISPLVLEEVSSSLKLAPKIIYMHPISKAIAEDILVRRLMRASTKEGKLRLSNLFHEDAVTELHKYSMGTPALLLESASKCLEILKNIHYSSARSKDASKLVVNRDMAIQACKTTRCYQAYTEYEGIGQFKMVVLKEIMGSFRSPTEISSSLRKDRTTISRHLFDLREVGLADFRTHGRESLYRATDAVRIRHEIEAMPKEVWEIA